MTVLSIPNSEESSDEQNVVDSDNNNPVVADLPMFEQIKKNKSSSFLEDMFTLDE